MLWSTFPHMSVASALREDLDDQPQCVLQIVGYIDDHRKHSGRHDRYVDETHGRVETLDSIATMASVEGSGGSAAAPDDTVPGNHGIRTIMSVAATTLSLARSPRLCP